MNSNSLTKKSTKFFENTQELEKTIKQSNKSIKEQVEKEIKKWNNIFGNKIKIKEKRRIIFKGEIQKFKTSSNTKTTVMYLKGTEKFQNEKLIILLPKDKKINRDTKNYVVLEI